MCAIASIADAAATVRPFGAVEEARRRGALGCTNSPQELIQMVTRALRTTRIG
ncbi:hypothetical protein [Actinoplanes sp. RD1]|uniref:hypothetical protein n=1 Tax=Actinoplanes sp. RD1 TaxID=3064538 RepID=UPI0027403608|nr:hypothetical protein [Actinoplanes sp. RD1]